MDSMGRRGLWGDAVSAAESTVGYLGSWDDPLPLDRTEALPVFPVRALPGWLGNYVSALAIDTQTPVDLAGVLGLGIVATATGGRVVIEVRPGWREPTNGYYEVGMPTGSRKSAVFARMTKPLVTWERRALDWARPDIATATARRRIAEDIVRQAERVVARADPEDRERLTTEAVARSEESDCIVVPAAPRLLADDATPEAVASLLAEQGGRLAILAPEGDIFDLIGGCYGRANLGVFLRGWSGDNLRVDRKGRPPEDIEHPALTMALAVQPQVLISSARHPDLRGRGLLDRFLYALPLSPVGHRQTSPPPVPMDLERRYEQVVEALVTVMVGEVEPVVLTLTPEARRCHLAFAEQLEPRLDLHTGDLGQAGGWGSKLAGQVIRIAGQLHVAHHVEGGWESPVEAETMEAAVEVGRYFIPHALAVFDLMSTNPVIADAKYVLAWARRTGIGRFTRRDAFSSLPRGRFRTVSELDPALAVLVEHGYLSPEPVMAKQGPGRPASPGYRVHPSVTHNPQNPPGSDCADSADD